MGAAAGRAPTRELPDWLVRLASLADPSGRRIVPELGTAKTPPLKKPDASSAGRRGLAKMRLSLPPKASCDSGS
jgi:hypothetical protein